MRASRASPDAVGEGQQRDTLGAKRGRFGLCACDAPKSSDINVGVHGIRGGPQGGENISETGKLREEVDESQGHMQGDEEEEPLPDGGNRTR